MNLFDKYKTKLKNLYNNFQQSSHLIGILKEKLENIWKVLYDATEVGVCVLVWTFSLWSKSVAYYTSPKQSAHLKLGTFNAWGQSLKAHIVYIVKNNSNTTNIVCITTT